MTSAGLQPAATRAEETTWSRRTEGKKRKLLLLFIDLSRRSAPSSPETLCCLYSNPLVSHFLLNSSLCANLGFNVHTEMWKTSLESTLSACTGKQKTQKIFYRQFNWSVRCSEIRADTNTWFHLKDKAERHLVLIIVINPVKQSWRSSSVCLYKYDFCKCNLKHCARIWMRPWFWYDRGTSWLRTGHDPGQDRRLRPESKLQNHLKS